MRDDSSTNQVSKRLVEECLPLITKIVNTSLSSGTFVEIWKSAIAWPLIKKQGSINVNYWPISNLGFLLKVLLKVALEQFKKFCIEYHLFPEYQFAYRAKRICETALIDVGDDILWAMEHKNITTLAGIVPCSTQLTMRHYRGTIKFSMSTLWSDWITTYLLNRELFVLMSMKATWQHGTLHFLCHREVVSDRLCTCSIPALCIRSCHFSRYSWICRWSSYEKKLPCSHGEKNKHCQWVGKLSNWHKGQ